MTGVSQHAPCKSAVVGVNAGAEEVFAGEVAMVEHDRARDAGAPANGKGQVLISRDVDSGGFVVRDTTSKFGRGSLYGSG